MMLKGRQKKDDQLGMPLGTASGHLKKKIMLALLRKLGADVCYRCQTTIATPEELSIEHKEPWLDHDPALFWDLRNITFSHRVCNRPNRPSGGITRRQTKQSVYRGVSWEEKTSAGKRRQKWSARISHNNRNIFLGYFDDEVQAAQAYDTAAIQLRGRESVASLNFPEGDA